MTEREVSGFSRSSWIAAVAGTAATYAYFLIFAQFALLALAAHGGESAHMPVLMAAMGAGGLGGAAAAAIGFTLARSRVLLRGTFAACALLAALATRADGIAAWLGVFAGVGVALGMLTVVLAASLRAATGGVRLGLGIGAGTGLAYALCNLPPVFTAEPRVQAWLAVGAAVAGWLSAGRLVPQPPAEARVTEARPAIVRWVLALTALVWMDSAVFAVIQQTPALRAQTWEGTGALLANSGMHLVAAIAAGFCLDRGGRRFVALAALALLGVASLMLAGVLPLVAPGWLYVAGVSLYSVVLVYIPAADGRATVAAWTFGVAGWIGSALGIGMAQDLHRVPPGFVAIATAAVVAALLSRGRGRATPAALLLAIGVVGLAGRAEAADLVARGREVYIAEGCMHCHSQFVRPRVAVETVAWGPAQPWRGAGADMPPLPGNRRQGPDLSAVGNRRSLEWNRLHLRAPRAVSPGSRMPSYAHLFAGGGDSSGEALLAYLATLGAETMEERLDHVATWRPADDAAIDDARARHLFARLCANCHGAEGRGDGVLVASLSVRPPDWREDGARRFHELPPAQRELELARLIKFGLPGSPMAGHEALPDADIVGLARLVRMWQKASSN